MKKRFSKLLKRLQKWFPDWDDVIIALGLISVAVGCHGFHSVGYGLLESLYRAIMLFTGESGPQDGPIPLSLEFARWGTLVVVSYAACKGLLILFHKLGGNFRTNNHVIIWGYNDIGKALAHEYLRQGKKIVVIDADPQLKEKIGLIWNLHPVVCDDARNIKKTLLESNVKTARSLFAVTDDDNFNVQISEIIFDLRRAFTAKNRLSCFVHITNQSLVHLCWNHPHYNLSHQGVSFKFFNSFDLSARALFNRFAPDIACDRDKKQPHILIIGCGEAGTSVLLQAARNGHFANSDKLAVSIIDLAADAVKQKLQTTYPGLDEIVDLHFYQRDITVVDAGELEAVSRGNPFLTAFVCLDSTDRIIETAYRLRRGFLSPQAKLVLMFRTPVSALSNLLHKLEKHPLDAEIHSFSMTREGHNIDNVVRESLDRCAKKMHAEASWEKINNERVPEWHELSEELKESSRLMADHFEIKLRAINQIRWKSGCVRFDATATLSDAELRILAEMEHRRWMAERVLNGWKYGAKKDPLLKTNPLILHWDHLKKEDQEKNIDFLKKRIPIQMQIRSAAVTGKSGRRLPRLITPDLLKTRIRRMNACGQDYAKEPVIGLIIRSGKYSEIPEVIRAHMGKVDQKNYADVDFSRYLNGAVVLQMKSATNPDFYPIEKEALSENYQFSLCDLSSPEMQKQAATLPEPVKVLLNDRSYSFVKLEKKITQIYELSTLGWPISDEVRLKNPDGGIQVKPAGREGFVACNRQSCYLINADERGFPCGYSLVGL